MTHGAHNARWALEGRQLQLSLDKTSCRLISLSTHSQPSMGPFPPTEHHQNYCKEPATALAAAGAACSGIFHA